MTERDGVWGAAPSPGYEELAARFRPLFHRIREDAVRRETGRILPFEPIGWLKEAGFGALRVPREQGGAGATLPELFALLAELAQADSNLTQALRAHFAYVEDVLNDDDPARRDLWFGRFVKGEIVGSAWTETGEARMAAFSTRVSLRDGRRALDGAKFYTTGSIFADWIDVGAVDEADEPISAVVGAKAAGVAVIDDWDGFGQRLTGSGTATFADVGVEAGHIAPAGRRFRYSAAFVQQVHHATLTGIARAAAVDVARAVAARRRSYSHAAAPLPAGDPQVLQVVGRVHSLAYAAGAVMLKAAESLQRCFASRGTGAPEDAATVAAEIEIAQAQTVVTTLALDATAAVFDALGASATLRPAGLDRYWRNARTVASHNPRIYKDRVVGDYAVNGTPPPFQWRIGQP